ncbi:MAG: hypothetical protein HQL51_01740 [Magnetococcales bacterium]|nr:hypothetical protein [Magnetococcales bacterium]
MTTATPQPPHATIQDPPPQAKRAYNRKTKVDTPPDGSPEAREMLSVFCPAPEAPACHYFQSPTSARKQLRIKRLTKLYGLKAGWLRHCLIEAIHEANRFVEGSAVLKTSLNELASELGTSSKCLAKLLTSWDALELLGVDGLQADGSHSKGQKITIWLSPNHLQILPFDRELAIWEEFELQFLGENSAQNAFQNAPEIPPPHPPINKKQQPQQISPEFRAEIHPKFDANCGGGGDFENLEKQENLTPVVSSTAHPTVSQSTESPSAVNASTAHSSPAASPSPVPSSTSPPLIFPDAFNPGDRKEASKRLGKFPHDFAQDILDELQGRLEQGKPPIDNPPGYLRRLCAEQEAGTLILELAPGVKQRREDAAKAATAERARKAREAEEAPIRKNPETIERQRALLRSKYKPPGAAQASSAPPSPPLS